MIWFAFARREVRRSSRQTGNAVRHRRPAYPPLRGYENNGSQAANELPITAWDPVSKHRSGPVGLRYDLHDPHMLAAFVELTWTVVDETVVGRDDELVNIVESREARCTQLAWLTLTTKRAAGLLA